MRVALLSGLVFGVVIVACSTPAPARCTTGMSVACVGAGGCAGGQVCNADGTFGACDCGGGHDAGGAGDTGSADTGADTGGSGACDPVAQTGCTTGERCAWRTDTNVLTCVANGTVAPLGACTITAGVDDCTRGNACAGAVCLPICDLSAPPAHYACDLYAGLFTDASGNPTNVGIGSPLCNPVTQTREADGAPACGSADPVTPSLGCYGSLDTLVFSCAHAGPAADTQGVAPLASAGGAPFLNGCAPGFIALRASDGTFFCSAFCTPGATSSESPANVAGLTPNDCPARGATGADANCRFAWMFQTTPTSSGNGIGLCFDPGVLLYDPSGSGTPDTAIPTCDSLSTSSAHYGELGCAPHS